MNLFPLFERASVFGLAALVVASIAQKWLDGRVPASWRVWLWRVALVQCALALLPLSPLRLAVWSPSPIAPVAVLEKNAPRFPLPAPLEPVVPSATDSSSSSSPALPVSPRATSLPEVAPLPRVSPPIETMRASRPFDWRGLVFAFYTLGLGVQFVLLLRSWQRVRRMIGACTPIQNAQIHVQLNQTARRMNVSPSPRLLQSEDGAPFLVGIFVPAIVLPRAPLATQSRDLEVVLAHELAHQKRRDLVWNAFLWPVQALFWFHPLVWIARRFLLLETESACDEMVLSSTRITPKFYGALLVHTMNTQETPFAAGVADGFFALKTRLIRLNRTPKRPHWALRVAFAVALCLAFGALVPLRFVARAQSAAVSPALDPVGGVVVDQSGKPVANATVYMSNGRGEPLETTRSDAKGAFTFSNRLNAPFAVDVFVDAGARGFGHHYTFTKSRGRSSLRIAVAPGARARLRVLDPQGQPASGVTLRLRGAALPLPLLRSMRATTNARGEATFESLPAGMTAQFVVDDERDVPTRFGSGDRRGGRFAPLSTEDAIVLRAPETLKTIRLLWPITIHGRISFPDGRGAGNVLVLARRINAAEAASPTGQTVPGRDFLIAQTRSNASGRYVLDGLRPGKYYVWTYPEKALTRNFAPQTFQKTFSARMNRVDFALSRGAVIQGFVLAKGSGEPVKGQTMWLLDSQENNQYTQTDANGFFQFRALGGKQSLRVHANGQNSPPPGFVLPAKSTFDFSVQNGQKSEFEIELPTALAIKPITGTVVGPDEKPLANATVSYRRLTYRADAFIHTTPTDGRGQFSIPAEWAAHPLQIWADAGELTSPRTSIFYGKSEITLRVEPGMWASFEGRVVDQNKLPVPGVKLNASTQVGNITLRAQSQTSDAKGHFRFDHLRPETSTTVNTSGNGYSLNGIMADLKAGENYSADIETRRATATLRGRVVLANGAPARGYLVDADGSNRSARTGADGRFFLPQVSDGPIGARVYSVKEGAWWRDFWARGGDQNVVFRLSQSKRIKPNSSGPRGDELEPKAQKLIGQMAPEIQAVRWSKGKTVSLSSLRGQVVVLSFDRFLSPDDNSLNDVASSFPGRVQVVGVQRNMMPKRDPKDNFWFDRAANSARFPLALDAPLSAPPLVSGGRTSSAYNNASYAVISRDGRIVYAGLDLERAVVAASKASQ